MAGTAPSPVALDSQVMKGTVLFEGNGAGWSESLHISYPADEPDPFKKMEAFMGFYNQARRAVLSDTNTMVACRMSLAADPGVFLLREVPSIGLGDGLVTGPPADINAGLQYKFKDQSFKINSAEIYGGWAQADMNQTTSSARDRRGAGPNQIVWNTSLVQFFTKDTAGNRPSLLGGGTPVIPAKPKGADAQEKVLAQGFTLDPQGRLVFRTAAKPDGWDKGQQLQIMYKKNRFVKNLAKTYPILDSFSGITDWQTTIGAFWPYPLEVLSLINIFGRLVTTRYYPITLVTIGNYSRRANGGQFFVHRGHRSR